MINEMTIVNTAQRRRVVLYRAMIPEKAAPTEELPSSRPWTPTSTSIIASAVVTMKTPAFDGSRLLRTVKTATYALWVRHARWPIAVARSSRLPNPRGSLDAAFDAQQTFFAMTARGSEQKIVESYLHYVSEHN